MRRLSGRALQMTVYLGEGDRYGGRPLYMALLDLLRREGLAGATVMRGIAGFGAHSVIHIASILRLSTDLPVVLVCVDEPERVKAVLPKVREMVREGLVVLSEVEVALYAHRPDHRRGPDVAPMG